MTALGSPPGMGAIYIGKNTVMDSFNKTSVFTKDAEIGFSTGSRAPLNAPTAGPGPGAYDIKTTLGKVMESNIKSPCQFTLRGREKFGDPNERALSKTFANEPGPGNYDLTDKFLGGANARRSGFPKGLIPREKQHLSPGPGSYKPAESMGKQSLSTKKAAVTSGFPLAPRPGMAIQGGSTVGPGEYKGANIAACEPQVDSRKLTSGSIKFGTGYRKGVSTHKSDLSEPSPGPGTYALPGGVATTARGTPFRNSPAAQLSGRNKFGSPW
mmetsp:Transcript_1634/g.1779  ORF Transcript_1634/g.1779 Transcript_1634/m.1779 type:complete len:269 (+) Transcript_1634:152-958(+)|eukprot:CAMPEP_0119035334 /NCGR_PEP_ID=MMETSP1177-20130426/2260_1 /TAXON_ID=2985 /ORGANISM="Ochromonas sp, Strain CCMP1899" /LENGTH=268 /DNA_ID=CAMNT_0006993395 /DNA_START=151 /DNA_END=957 /DNA_ORIENTATION=+